MALTQAQANSFIEKIGQVFDVPVFTEAAANRLLSLARASVEWEAAIKEELSNAGLPHSPDQIQRLPCDPANNPSILSLDALAPLFTLYNLEADKDNLSALLHNVTASKGLDDALTEKLMDLGLPVTPENVKKLGGGGGPGGGGSGPGGGGVPSGGGGGPSGGGGGPSGGGGGPSGGGGVPSGRPSGSGGVPSGSSGPSGGGGVPSGGGGVPSGGGPSGGGGGGSSNSNKELYVLQQVQTMRPEYLTGTWFNKQERPFKVSMELDWVNRMSGTDCYMPPNPMNVWLFGNTGEHIWDFISEIHVHPTATMGFTQPKDGWIEAPPGPARDPWNYDPADSLLNYIDRMIQVGARSVFLMRGGIGGWATFERTTIQDLTVSAARQLFKYTDPLYCARSDGKVVIKLMPGPRATLRDMSKFPSRRTLVTDKNKFPSCIRP